MSKILGLDKLSKQLSKIREGAYVEKGLTKTALRIDRDAKMNCPVDTGNLRGSITFDVNGDCAEIGTNVEYAPYVEYGTLHQPAKPFLGPAFEDNKHFLHEDIINELRKELFND